VLQEALIVLFFMRSYTLWEAAFSAEAFYLLFQVERLRRISMGKISRRPASMSRIKTNLERGLNSP